MTGPRVPVKHVADVTGKRPLRIGEDLPDLGRVAQVEPPFVHWTLGADGIRRERVLQVFEVDPGKETDR